MSRGLIGRWIVATSLVVLMATVASSQQRGQVRGGAGLTGPPSMGKVGLARNPWVQEELKLDDDQKTKVGEIVARLLEARGEQPDAETRQQFRERLQAFSQTLAEEVKKLDEVLKEDQHKRLNEISLQNAGILALFREDVAGKLELSDEQKEKLQAMLREQREQAQREQAQRGEDRPRGVAAIRERRQQWEQQLTAVLSEDQKKKWEELKGEPFQMGRRGGGGAEGERRRPQN